MSDYKCTLWPILQELERNNKLDREMMENMYNQLNRQRLSMIDQIMSLKCTCPMCANQETK